VKIGVSDDSYWELTEGLKENDEVISGGYKAINSRTRRRQKVRKGAPPKEDENLIAARDVWRRMSDTAYFFSSSLGGAPLRTFLPSSSSRLMAFVATGNDLVVFLQSFRQFPVAVVAHADLHG